MSLIYFMQNLAMVIEEARETLVSIQHALMYSTEWRNCLIIVHCAIGWLVGV